MAHVQSNYAKLWKPQNLALDRISSQRMFIDNIDALEEFALSTLKKSCAPVASITELKAIDTSDNALYITGTMIMVRSNGLYFFDRASTATDNNNTIIAPIVGGGRWISDKIFFGSLAFKDSVTKADVGLGNVPNVATNDQTPTYTQAAALGNLVSGEKLSVSMGKIMKATADLITHLANKANPHTVTKAQVGLGNVDNTSDMDKPVSTAQATSIADAKKAGTDAQTDLSTHTNAKTNPHGVTATQIGLGNVDNTSDANKPISTAQATAIADAKKAGTDAQTNLTTHTNTKTNPHGVTATQVGLGNVPNVATNDQTPTYSAATTLATLTSGEKLSVSMGKIMKGLTDLIAHLASRINPHGVTATQVGLGNVDNTSDANKPISTAQATAIADAKKAGTDAQTNLTTHTNTKTNPHGVTATQVGLGNVPNVATNDQTPTYTQASTLATLTSGETLSVSMGKIMKGLTDLIAHLANKANPHTVTKAQVGLGSVDNTSDMNKPISTAMQTALNGKANMIDGEVPTASYLRLTGFSLLNGVNLNTVKYTGQYGIMTNCTNRPVSTGTYDTLEVIMYSSHWLIQRYYVLNSAGVIGGVYMRSYIGDSTWTEWKLYNMGTGTAIANATVVE